MMKISVLIYSLASGGAERVVSVLLNELSKKHQITLILMNDTIFYEIPNNIKIKFLEKSIPQESGIKKLLKLPLLGWKYKKLLKDIDVSISFMNRPNYINVLAKLFGAKSRVIISERIAPTQEYKTNSLKDRISRFLINLLYPKADLVVPNSKYIEYELRKIFGVEKTAVIYNPIEKIECKKETHKDFIFIHIGRMEPQKNHKLLIKAFKRANLDAKLWLIGDGYLRSELEKLVNDLKIEDKVTFLGRQKDVYKYLSQANCFILSSNYEGFPNVLLEALNCNLPIISTDCKSGPRELLAPNKDFTQVTDRLEIAEYGILVKVGDEKYLSEAMKIMFENRELRYNYEIKAKERINEFKKEKIIKKWEGIINEKQR